MGKIKTEGRVTLEFEPDLYEISITVRAVDNTSGSAISAGKRQTEALLNSLQNKLGIKPEQITSESEEVDTEDSYDSNDKDESYEYSRNLILTIPTNNALREGVTDLLTEMNDVTFSISPLCTNTDKHKQTAIDSAVRHAMKKAEQIASSLNCRIVGFEEIITDRSMDTMNWMEQERVHFLGEAPKRNMAAELQNPKIKISGEVTVVWLTEPME